MKQTILLETKQICHHFDLKHASIQILERISFDIKHSEIISISGVSGSGKSTLMFILSGLLKPCSGDVYFEGKPLYQLPDATRYSFIGKNIGFLFQDFQLLNDFTVFENIQIAIRLANQRPNNDEIDTLLKQTQLHNRKHHYPSELSGGEKQRVALLRALIKKPKLLFCDEPTGNLDKENAKLIIDLIEHYHHEFGLSVIIVSHQDDIKKMAQQQYRLDKGLLSKLN